jgi:ACS family glucarate transporter-like MFS transporter
VSSNAHSELQTPTGARKRVVAFTLALVAIAYLDRVCISTAAPTIRAELGLDQTQMGLVFSVFTFTYGLFEMPSGWFADRFGARKALVRIVVFWSVMTAVTGAVVGFASLLLARLFFGMGEAGAFPATARAYSRWLPDGERSRAFGIAIMTGALGGALTQPLVVWLLPVVGWRGAFALFGIVGLVWSALFWWYFRDEPRDHRGVNAAELAVIGAPSAPLTHGAVPFGALVRNRTVVALCLMYAGTIYGWYFYLTWLPTYLVEGRRFDLKATGWLSAGPLVGIACGVFSGGLLGDWLPTRFGARNGWRIPGLVGLPTAACAVVGAVATASPMLSAILLSLAAMFAALGVAPAWTLCIEIGGVHAGIVSGTMNMFGNLGGAAVSLVVGFGLQRLHSWQWPLYSIAAFYLASAVSWLWVDPTSVLIPKVAAVPTLDALDASSR